MISVSLRPASYAGLLLMLFSPPGSAEPALAPESAGGFVSVEGMCLPPGRLGGGGGRGTGADGAAGAGFGAVAGSRSADRSAGHGAASPGGAARFPGLAAGGLPAAPGHGRGKGNDSGDANPDLALAGNPDWEATPYQASAATRRKGDDQRSASAPLVPKAPPSVYAWPPLFAGGPSLATALLERTFDDAPPARAAGPYRQGPSRSGPPSGAGVGAGPGTANGNHDPQDAVLDDLSGDALQGLAAAATQGNVQILEQEPLKLLDGLEPGLAGSPPAAPAQPPGADPAGLAALVDPLAVPEPTALGLVGTGLLGLVAWRRRSRA